MVWQLIGWLFGSPDDRDEEWAAAEISTMGGGGTKSAPGFNSPTRSRHSASISTGSRSKGRGRLRLEEAGSTSGSPTEVPQGTSKGEGIEVPPRPVKSEGGNSDGGIRKPMEKVEKPRNAIEALKAEKSSWERRAQGLERDLREAHEEAGRDRAQLHELKRQFSEMERRLAANEKVLQAQANELTVAQSFLTTADDFSGADVSRMVAEVNDAIFQCASLMADELEDSEEVTRGREGVETTARQQLIAAGWSEGLIQLLLSRVLAKDAVLFEALVQNVLVRWCHDIVASFCYEGRDTDRFMKGLWSRIATSKDHKVAKNWLAITHSQLEKEAPDMTPIVEVLTKLMLCTGWKETTPERKDFSKQIETKVEDIRSKALEIKEVVTQKILSAEVRVFYPPPDSRYDADEMEDAHAVGSGAKKAGPGELIFCSTGLGVEYIVAHSYSSGGQRNSRSSTILKATVMLRSTADTRLGPPLGAGED